VPSAVSQQIAALEKIVSKRLVERSRGSRAVGLTPAGELVLRQRSRSSLASGPRRPGTVTAGTPRPR